MLPTIFIVIYRMNLIVMHIILTDAYDVVELIEEIVNSNRPIYVYINLWLSALFGRQLFGCENLKIVFFQ